MIPIVVLAGGLAKRIRPVTENIPKSLIIINGKPFIDWQLELLANKGFSKVILCVSHLSNLIKDHVGDGSKYNLEILYSDDGPNQLGTGGAIKNALPLIEGEFIVTYGDAYLDIEYKDVIQAFSKFREPAMMTVYENRNMYDLSNVDFRANRIHNYEKNNPNPSWTYIDYGLSFFRQETFINDKYGTCFDLSDVWIDLSKKRKLAAYEVSSRFYEIGSLEGIQEFSKYLKRGKYVI